MEDWSKFGYGWTFKTIDQDLRLLKCWWMIKRIVYSIVMFFFFDITIQQLVKRKRILSFGKITLSHLEKKMFRKETIFCDERHEKVSNFYCTNSPTYWHSRTWSFQKAARKLAVLTDAFAFFPNNFALWTHEKHILGYEAIKKHVFVTSNRLLFLSGFPWTNFHLRMSSSASNSLEVKMAFIENLR